MPALIRNVLLASSLGVFACGEGDVTHFAPASGTWQSSEDTVVPALRPGDAPAQGAIEPPRVEPPLVGPPPVDAVEGDPPKLVPPAAANDAGPVSADAGPVLNAICERGALECQGSLIARCNAQQSDFELVRDCREARLCDAARARCGFEACAETELGCGLAELPSSEGVLGVALGRQFTCAVIAGGALRCWGRNHRGQLGYGRAGNIGDVTLPAAAGNVDVGGAVSQVAAGLGHTCALFTNGEVSCWGHAGSGGRLGDGDYERRKHFAELLGLTPDVGDDETPASVARIDLGGSAIQLAAGYHFTCALLASGDVRCWGTGYNGAIGQIATSTVGAAEKPASVPPVDLGGPAAFLAAGTSHSCAIMRTGEVRCWGRGSGGVLGYGDTEDVGDDETPASAGSVALSERAVHLSVSETHSCAVLSSGAVQCWGDDFARQLSGETVQPNAGDGPGAVHPALDLGARVTRVAAGNGYTCALLADGAVRCWGVSRMGQLGSGKTAYRPFANAEPRVDLGGTAVELEANHDHACAILDTRELICWGLGYDGNLGYGNTEDVGDDETPASVGVVPVLRIPPQPDPDPVPEPPVSALDAGSSTPSPDAGADVIDADVIDADATEADAGVVLPQPIEGVALGDQHTCVLTVAGSVRCWGDNEFGQLGYAHTRDIGLDQTPAAAGDVDVGGPVRQLASGSEHTCALLENGEVRCWGHADNGQLGLGTANIGDDEHPASVPSIDLGGPALQISAGGGGFTCALLVSGDVRCWGSGSNGQLGQGPLISRANPNIGDDETPASFGPVDVGGPSVVVAVGQNHACALSVSGDVRCWGRGSTGRLGYGNTQTVGDDETPASAGTVSLGGAASDLSLGTAHSCAILQGGGLRCWGSNAQGQLGYARDAPFQFTLGDDETPIVVPSLDLGQPVMRAAAGDSHTCALLADGGVRCWGANREGQLGSATSATRVSFSDALSRLDLGAEAISVASGEAHSCAVLSTRELSCWGDVENGKLGYGQGLANVSVGDNETPAAVGAVPVF